MSNGDAVAFAERMGEAAAKVYLRDGFVMLGVQTDVSLSQPGMSATPPPGDPRVTIPRLMRLMTWATRCRYIALIAEAWTQEADEDAPEPAHGDMAAVADRDPSVRTSIAVSVWDAHDPDIGATVAFTPELGDDGAIDWRIHSSPGSPKGELADIIRHALVQHVPMPAPRVADLNGIGGMIVEEGGAREVIVVIAHPDPELN
jgi:hypothetical protein